jgi:hypothetical protein
MVGIWKRRRRSRSPELTMTLGQLPSTTTPSASSAFGAVKPRPVIGTLVPNTLTAPFTPPTPNTFYLELTGSGSVTLAVVYLFNDGSIYGPEVVAVDG